MKDDRIIVRVDSVRKKFIKNYAENKNLTVSKIFRDWIDWLQERTLKHESRTSKEISNDRKDTDTPPNGTGSS